MEAMLLQHSKESRLSCKVGTCSTRCNERVVMAPDGNRCSRSTVPQPRTGEAIPWVASVVDRGLREGMLAQKSPLSLHRCVVAPESAHHQCAGVGGVLPS